MVGIPETFLDFFGLYNILQYDDLLRFWPQRDVQHMDMPVLNDP